MVSEAKAIARGTAKVKTRQTRKAARKLKKLQKSGKLKRHTIDRFNELRSAKHSAAKKRSEHIAEDWRANEENDEEEEEEMILPDDMLDPEMEWEQVGGINEDEDAKDENLVESKKRKFDGELDDDQEELLPIRLADGRIIRPVRRHVEAEDASTSEEKKNYDPSNDSSDILRGLSAAEIVVKRGELMEEAKQTITTHAMQLLADPQTNIYRLRDLYNLCCGQGVHAIIRESVQKMAVVSMTQVLVDIIPGYPIRTMTEEEKGGDTKMKKVTKQLQTFEEALLRYHLKFLQFLEKNIKKFSLSLDPHSFSSKLALISLRSLNTILLSAPHFNYSTNIVLATTRVALAGHEQALAEVCTALCQLFKDDIPLKISLFAVKTIAGLVKKKVAATPPKLLATFLDLKIKKVEDVDKKSEKGAIMSKKYRLQKERKSKSRTKYDKQLKKLEGELKEAEAAENISNKLRTATEVMKHVFTVYFSILRRMPSLKLLEPVLEGLSKFAHLLNIDFFEDIVQSLEALIDKQHLRLIDSLHCINTVFVLLSGEGQALNVDPARFYKSAYRLLNTLPFEKEPEMQRRECEMMARCFDRMMNARKKQVPTARVASFVRRILAISLVLDASCALPLVHVTRSFFIAHPRLASLLEVDAEDAEEGGSTSLFRPDLDDPDCSHALSSDALMELRRLSKRPNRTLAAVARNMLNGVPSVGPHRLDTQIAAVKPWQLVDDANLETMKKDTGALAQVQAFGKRKKITVSSENLHHVILLWLAEKA